MNLNHNISQTVSAKDIQTQMISQDIKQIDPKKISFDGLQKEERITCPICKETFIKQDVRCNQSHSNIIETKVDQILSTLNKFTLENNIHCSKTFINESRSEDPNQQKDSNFMCHNLKQLKIERKINRADLRKIEVYFKWFDFLR